MIDWIWSDDSVLNSISLHTPSCDIFQAVCDELGRYYSQYGAKYVRSSHKIKRKFDKVRCEFSFRSSHSNMAGEWVNLEIVTSVYAVDKSRMERGGLLYFHIRPKNFNVYGIDIKLFSEIVEYLDGNLKLVESFETADGIRGFCGEEKFINEHANNQVYFVGLE